MAIGIHIARVGMIRYNSAGAVVNPNTASIAQMAGASSQPGVLADSTIANTTGNPTIQSYIALEAASGYVVYHVDQTMIITYAQADLNDAK